jgi:hypothetical protein
LVLSDYDQSRVVAKSPHELPGVDRTHTQIIPDERYFSMPSAEGGGDARR